MDLHVGTSGYSYAEWKGSFYPEKLPAKDMLKFYAESFDTVEINNTFYRMPQPSLLTGWMAQVPSTFTFVLKAPRRLSHGKAWSEDQAGFDLFVKTARTLEGRLGPVLFQLPPFAKKDTERLARLLSYVPEGVKLALEVRNPSWLDDEVFALLGKHDAALCVSDDDVEKLKSSRELPDIASWGYLRLRKTEYSDADLRTWLTQIGARSWKDAYVFFKHEESGSAPAFAKRFQELWAEVRGSGPGR